MKRRLVVSVSAVLVAVIVSWGMAISLAAAGADWKDELKAALRANYTLTKTGMDRLRITQPGTVFVLRADGVRADLATDLTLYANKVDVQGGQIAQAGGAAVALLGGKETSRSLKAGEEMYLFDVDVKDAEVRYQLLTTNTYQVNVKGSTKEMRYKALLVFRFGEGALAGLAADDVLRATSVVVAPKEEVLAAASQPKTIALGQTQAEVEAVLGKPEKIINLGPKVTYVYKDIKVIFADGKVVDVQ